MAADNVISMYCAALVCVYFIFSVIVVVYLSRAVSLIFHFDGGTTYRGQGFPRVLYLTYLFLALL